MVKRKQKARAKGPAAKSKPKTRAKAASAKSKSKARAKAPAAKSKARAKTAVKTKPKSRAKPVVKSKSKAHAKLPAVKSKRIVRAKPAAVAAKPKLVAVSPKPPINDEWKSSERWQSIVAKAREWGYFGGAIKSRLDLWHGRSILDVGMGAGPHSVSFIEGGAKLYVGVDPLVGTETVRDFRSLKDPSFPPYHPFDYTVQDIMDVCPRIKLHPGLLEDVTDQLREQNLELAMLAAVTEHLQRPDQVIRGIWEVLAPSGLLWISHCNYYSWTGHHRNPRSVAQWNRANAEENLNVDWKHLEPSHPDYSNANFNRVRLDDLRVLISKYFDIIEFKVVPEGLARLTQEIRRRYAKYTLAELLGQNIYITGRRREKPLDIDLSDRQFFHPSEDYLAEKNYEHEDLGSFRLLNSVYFSKSGELHSHSDNESAGLRVFDRLHPGDRLEVTKFTNRLTFTVDEVLRPQGANPRVRLRESVPEEFRTTNYDQWTVAV